MNPENKSDTNKTRPILSIALFTLFVLLVLITNACRETVKKNEGSETPVETEHHHRIREDSTAVEEHPMPPQTMDHAPMEHDERPDAHHQEAESHQ